MADEIGLIGLGRMGRNLAANMMARGIAVTAWDRSADARAGARAADPDLSVAGDVAALAQALSPPRCVMLSVPDGDAVETCLAQLGGVLEAGDVVIDAGNSHYRDTERRQQAFSDRGLHLLGLGVSGGPEGARHGPSLMAGGPEAAWRRAGPVLEAVAARAGGEPSAGYLGQGGSGHFVKMVHNGIEYAILQILADVFELLSEGCAMDGDGIARAFAALDAGATAGFLVGTSARVAAARDEAGTGFLIDSVDDRAEHNRTGSWTVEAATDFGVSVPTIAAAVQFRVLSANERLRLEAQDAAARRSPHRLPSPEKIISLVGPGLGCAMASAFAQGFALIAAAGERFGAPLDRRRIASLWRAGSILEGAMVELIAESLAAEPLRIDLLGCDGLRPLVAGGMEPLRELAMAGLAAGLPVPGLSTAVGYVDVLRRSPLSTRFIQLQRDYFGGHGFRPVGGDGRMHGPWREDEDT